MLKMKIILIHGPMAAGKSTITEKLREKLPKYAYVDRPYIKGLKPLGKELALKLSKKATYEIMKDIINLKKNMIVQEVNPVSLRKKLKNHLKKYQVYAFYIKCSIKEAKKREKQRAKKARPKRLEEIHKKYAEPSKYETIIDTEKLSVKQSVDFILKSIRK
jgi:adenylylsulfate kinase-like enzyme